MHKSLTILLSVAALALAIPAAAVSCTMTTSEDAIALPGDLYVANDACQPDCLLSVIVYEETNGVEGLQRADQRRDDTCDGRAGNADERVF